MIIEAILQLYGYAALITVVAISLYGIVRGPSLIKKLIALTILGDTANVLIIFLGFRFGGEIYPPILPTLNPTQETISWFISVAVDPVPQCLVITAIVINMAITMFLAFLIIQVYRLYGTTMVKKIARLKG
ncbi:MAG: sodium:proton antiporter [Candidatus Nezhaarchaeota archaeon]|nr:sodium:proton antiporter [Candidatus Nezhaarchaeota archaeon]MCX8142322.1 sodium:proton antiporter [Candidatus Nezhaarchaeota archaeon]MDW8050705.1 sodium:proton antiporter [Nitrososphaerota archaeon]